MKILAAITLGVLVVILANWYYSRKEKQVLDIMRQRAVSVANAYSLAGNQEKAQEILARFEALERYVYGEANDVTIETKEATPRDNARVAE